MKPYIGRCWHGWLFTPSPRHLVTPSPRHPLTLSRRLMGVLLLAAVAGCGGSQEDGKSDDANKGPVIGVSLSQFDDPLQQQIKADIMAAAEKRPDLEFVFKDAAGDSPKQQEQVREFIQQRVEVIILSLDDPQGLTAPVTEAMQANIPVVLLHRGVIGGEYTCLLRVDDEKIGAAAGAWIAERFAGRIAGKGGTLVELKGKPGSREADRRERGFRSAIKDGDFRTSFPGVMDWNEKDARAAMEEALSQHRKIAAVFAHNDVGARGAYLAAQAAGREQEMAFVGVGGLPQEGMRLIKEGILAASLEYPTGGSKAVEVAIAILAGKSPEKEVWLPLRIFTTENVDRGGDPIE